MILSDAEHDDIAAHHRLARTEQNIGSFPRELEN